MITEQNQNIHSSNNQKFRFSKLQQLETINFAAHHQNILQALVGRNISDEVERIVSTEPNLEAGIKILEIGTGQGLTTREILKIGKVGKVVSIDNDLEMVEQAVKNLKKYINSGKLDIKIADALEFLSSLSPASFPLIASGFTLHNFKNDYREKVLIEIFRILEVGGLFISADKIMPDDKDVFERESRWQYEQFQKIPDSKIREEWIKHYKEDEAPAIIMKECALKRIMEQIGFVRIEISNRHHLDALITARK